VTTLDAARSEAMFDPDAISQVIVNLLRNASEAVMHRDNGRTIEVRTRNAADRLLRSRARCLRIERQATRHRPRSDHLPGDPEGSRRFHRCRPRPSAWLRVPNLAPGGQHCRLRDALLRLRGKPVGIIVRNLGNFSAPIVEMVFSPSVR
jgi:signal transduction histidine kinase